MEDSWRNTPIRHSIESQIGWWPVKTAPLYTSQDIEIKNIKIDRNKESRKNPDFRGLKPQVS